MAKATKEVKQVEVTKIEEQEIITLELSKEEAEVLRFIVESIGGCPYESNRRFADSIAIALRKAGVVYHKDYNGTVNREHANIYFIK